MAKRLKDNKKTGLPPGSVVYTGEARSEDVSLSLINYDAQHCDEKHEISIDAVEGIENKSIVSWINVNGIHDVEVIKQLGERIALHPLVMEDLVNVRQRPKLEDFDDHLFIVLKMLYYKDGDTLNIEQVSLIVGDTFVISFQEYAGDVFDPIRKRLRDGKGRIRKMGADYLAYALIDTIVDHYFVVIEKMGEHIELLEEQLLENPTRDLLLRINGLKREAILIRKSIWPLREVVSTLQRSESPLIKKKTEVFLRDVYDHTVQVVDMVETYRDLLASLTDLYMSSLSQKMNEVMQFLTIVGAIFIPLTFIAGVYGMNFDHMPELHFSYGYPAIMALMLAVGISSLIYFKRKKWL